MSMMSDSGAISAAQAIINLMDKIKAEPPEEQLKQIRQEAEAIISAAKAGYW